MARIKVLGGTGFAGEAVVREAARRGHTVTSYSRRPPSDPVDGVEYVNGSLLDSEVMAKTVENADVVFEAISPRGDMEGREEEIVDQLIRLADDAGVRLGVLGGVSSLLVSEGGPRLFDVSEQPPEVLPEIRARIACIWGGADGAAGPYLQARRDKLAAIRPDAAQFLIEGAGHWVQYEAAERFNELVRQILG